VAHAASLGLTYTVPLRRLTLTFGLDGSLTWSAVPVTPFLANAAQQQQANQTATDTTGTQQKPAAPIAPPPPQAPINTVGGTAIPYNVVLTSGTLRAMAGSSYLFTRRLSLGDSLTAYTAGGLNAKELSAPKLEPGVKPLPPGAYGAQLIAPINRGGTLAASLSYMLTKRDRIFTSMSGGYTVVLPPPPQDGTQQLTTNAVIGTVTEGYARTFSKQATGTIGAGYAIGTSKTTGSPRDNNQSAVGNASFAYTDPLARNSSLVLRASAFYGLAVNVYGGAVNPSVSCSGGASFIKPPFTASAGVDFSSTLNATPQTQYVSGSATIGFLPAPMVLLLVGGSLQKAIIPEQNALAVGYPNDSLQWAVFVAASMTAPVLSF
jgi:hypothetical protein